MRTTISGALDLTIAANFAAEGVRDSVEFWFRELKIRGTVSFAPFDQIIQYLLGKSRGPSTANQISAILVQVERWSPRRDRLDATELRRNVEDLVVGLETAVSRGQHNALVVILCPPSPQFRDSSEVHVIEDELRHGVSSLAGVDFVTTAELERLYPNPDYDTYFDPYTDELAQMPYTSLCLATLGTMIVRRVYALLSAPCKVVVADCDNTLWTGMCGEGRPEDVSIGPGRRRLQEFLIGQSNAGRLLCLCSKNEEGSVWAVFDSHRDMVLDRAHLTAWRINRKPKAENLKSLSAELGLGLDTFVFLDDDAFECGAIKALCPDVLASQVPSDELELEAYVRNIWELDLRSSTDEDRNRGMYYRQVAEREQNRRTFATIKEFLSTLQLEVEIGPLEIQDIARAVQLTERTNQFNLNGIRRSAAELRAARSDARWNCWVVRARDRFGDYGSVGLIICRLNGNCLSVETLLLSCRALGKGIEQHIVNKLTQIARDAGMERLVFAYQPTGRNLPLQTFLADFAVASEKGIWRLDVARSGNPVGCS
jgi:FkbH-like protein